MKDESAVILMLRADCQQHRLPFAHQEKLERATLTNPKAWYSSSADGHHMAEQAPEVLATELLAFSEVR